MTAHIAERIFQQLVLLSSWMEKTLKQQNKPHQTKQTPITLALVFKVWPLFLGTIDSMYEEDSMKLALCLMILIKFSSVVCVCVYEGHSF